MTSERRIINVFHGCVYLLVVKCRVFSLTIMYTQTTQMVSAGSVFVHMHTYTSECVCERERQKERESKKKKLSI